MKMAGKSAYRLLSMVLCICMVLSLMPMMPLVAEAATVPNYISSIGISQDGSSGSTGVNDCKRELAGHTIIDVDLNDEAGGDYVYMGYKTTTDPAQAITGIVFRVGKNPPNSISYGGSTFYLVGGSTEANTAQLGGYIDLNARAGGYYIYTYVTRDPNYGAPLTNLTVNRSSSYSGWYAGTDTDGNVMDLNDDASNYYLYLHYQRFTGKASSTFYYLNSGGSRTSSTTSVSVKNHTQSVSTTPSVPSTVTYDGRTFTFRGWREDNTASSTVSPSYTYMTSKTYRAVYSATVALSYNANGGSGAPSSQTATQYINAGSSSVSKTSHSFTISATKPTYDDSKCVFLGWSTGSSAISASHQPGRTITISSNTTLYAVWRSAHTANRTYVNNGADHTYTWPCCGKSVTEAHSYTDGFCVCGAMIPDAVATVSRNGKVVAAYTILNDAIQALKDCTAADEAVITILKDIALGDDYQSISSGVFTIDLNGFEISSTNDRWGALYLSGTDVNVIVQGAGESSKITGSADDGINIFDKATLTITGGTITGKKQGVYAVGSTVTINGGTISGDRGVYTGYCTLIISDGTISGRFGVDAIETDLIISDGTISGDLLSVHSEDSTVTISGGSISTGDRHIYSYNSTTTLTLGENGVGARFLGGITVMYATLNEILGEGAAYWQGDKQIIPADNANAIFNGDVVIKAYVATVYSGWTEIDGNWCYYDPDTNTPVTGITRVPYPAEVINGVTYAPNMEDVKYANDKGTLFKDSISAFFVFDENGVFQSGLNGMTSDNRWAVNGCIVWHVGLVQVGEDYYYFIGDVDNGGNKMATGDVYVSRNTTDFDMVPGGVYTFGEDGKLCMYEGIVDVNGVLRYYENAQLMLGNGLTKVGENYIYVNSKGELIVDAEYYVPGNDLGIASGLYYFDENGYLVEPVSTDKDGVYFENGAWYYYVDGKIAYNQGLISVNTTWHGADGSENVYSGYIYVRSSGKLATGTYYITNVSNDASGLFSMGMKVLFDENGIADAPKNGIYEINGELYYFVKNQIQYNAGLIEYNGGWIYVRSSGKLAVGDYWITNTNGAMDQGMYEFGENGYMVIVDIEDGIVSDNGVLYYYLDGKKQYGLGLRQLSDGSYIYVRTNGQLAVGSYWITNHNGLLPEGLYTFGEDGILTAN